MDNQATIPFGCRSSTAFLSVQPDKTDAKKILTLFPSEKWRTPPGRSRTTWMKTIQQEKKSSNLSLNETIDVTQNRPLWRLMSTFGMHYSLLAEIFLQYFDTVGWVF